MAAPPPSDPLLLRADEFLVGDHGGELAESVGEEGARARELLKRAGAQAGHRGFCGRVEWPGQAVDMDKGRDRNPAESTQTSGSPQGPNRRPTDGPDKGISVSNTPLAIGEANERGMLFPILLAH